MKLSFLISAVKIRDLRKKILFILFIFLIFRLLANIPIPGVEKKSLEKLFQEFKTFGLLNIFTGGALERVSIAMLGLGPYITAIIILQVLTLVFPSLEKMYKEGGKEGREKFEQYGRILTIPLCFLQAFGMISLFKNRGILPEMDFITTLSSLSTVTAGTVFLMWLGELISEKGLGNGVSLLIFAGIAADFPNSVKALVSGFAPERFLSYLLFLLMVLVIVTGVVFINESKRNIPVSYSKRVRGMKLFGGVSTYLPLSVNPAGVIPIIFAISFLTFPPMIGNFFASQGGLMGSLARQTVAIFENPLWHSIFYFVLVVGFTYFYTFIVFNPKSVSQNLQKFGGFIPGIRPGKPTSNYISFVLNRVLVLGSVFLGLIAIMPTIVQSITKIGAFRFLVGGTSVLILVSVILETIKQLKAELEMREYEV
jgi:preprotein translocase subunit SecY